MVKQLKRFSSKKVKKIITLGTVHIKSTFNNTIVTIAIFASVSVSTSIFITI